MARMRSPNYPSIPLGQAIALVKEIHTKNRTNVIDRASAATDMGYSGLTGRSLKLLGALAQFDLVSKAGKGNLKVTQTAVDILHGLDDKTKAAALRKAGAAPAMFKELFERFPEGIPSENVIRSYLVQRGYGDVAIGPAVRSFIDTNHFLENAAASESHGDDDAEDAESPAHIIQPESSMNQHTAPPSTATAISTQGQLADTALNKINMNIQGDKVHVDALLDYKGLALLEKKIAGLRALLEADEPESADESVTVEKLMG